MNIEDCDCSDESIESILSEGRDELVSDKIANHVATCQKCQNRLEVMAASANEWVHASEMLVGFDRADTYRSSRESKRTQPWIESMARQILSPASHPEMLGRIGRYEVDRLIGSGGMGIVFKAIDTELNRPVAIKVLAPYLANLGTARQRFAREAKAAAAVVHEHVVPIHTVESDGESPYLVMHYVAGESLQARLDREGSLELREILRIGTQVAAGLAAAHAQGLIHRDIKPSNILLEQGVERSLITDFGLARSTDDASLTNTGYHAGTPQYMSPEQARGDTIDARSDLFSFGSMLYAMCTGRPPFRAETAYGTLRKITDTEARDIREHNPDIPDWLCQIIHRLMSKDASQRYSNADEVSTLLAECLAHVQQPTTHGVPASLRPHSTRSKSPRYIWRAAIVALAGLSILIAFWNGVLDFLNEKQQAQSRVPNSNAATSTKPSNQPQAPRVVKPLKLASDPSDNIRNAIRKEIELQCNDVPLEGVLSQISELVGIDIDLQRASLADVGVDPQHPVSIQARGPASELLQRICTRLQLGYIAHDSSLEIASIPFVGDHPATRFYDCAHILPDSRHIRSVVYAIESMVEPTQWQIQGGQGSITLFESALVIRATESMHLQIEQLLACVGTSVGTSNIPQKSIP